MCQYILLSPRRCSSGTWTSSSTRSPSEAHHAHLQGKFGGLLCELRVLRHETVAGCAPWLELSLDCEKARLPPLIQVDAFSGEPFQGNPAAVVLLSPAAYHKDGASEWMQRVAIENNLSETAYVALRERTAQTPNDVVEYDLRWFTPGMEVKLCGHATLSTAFALYDTGRVTTSQTLHFYTLSGQFSTRYFY
ncbi:hypothetical protein PC110_g18911 [Phytophthora cactorum]|uniref:Phenazine biosynthesis PhzF protein n=1 Tax=Phytophthora cactorum TaxID=29920 RepID=A0A329RJW3_9STRA|nr:hypothetical protein PC110_g18911 [Phytophthora cactorum]